jgi:hypothetical protein
MKWVRKCNISGGYKKLILNFVWEALRDQGVDVRLIIKWILEK